MNFGIPKKVLSIMLGSVITPSFFTSLIFLSTYETLENKYKHLILPLDAEKDKWKILETKLTSAGNEENLSYYFKQIKQSSNIEKLPNLCHWFLNSIYKSAIHYNSTSENNFQNFCTLKIKDVIKGKAITKDKYWIKRIVSIEKSKNKNIQISSSFKFLQAKIKVPGINKIKIIKDWCLKTYESPYIGNSSKIIAREAEKYCSFIPK